MGTFREPLQEPLEGYGYADQLNIETPEQVDVRFPVAGIGSRFLALFLDHLFQFLTYLVVTLLLAWWGSSMGSGTSSTGSEHMGTGAKWFLAIFILFNFLLIVGYFALFEAFWHGQTPGKRIMKLRVIKDTGRQITLFEALARNVIRFVDFLPSIYLAGVIAMLCSKKNKRLGDLAAGTLVVHELRVEAMAGMGFGVGENFFAKPGEVRESGLLADAVARLGPEDLHVVETFFVRALDLDMATREAVARKIAVRLAAKMGVEVGAANPERMLEQVGKGMRGGGRRF